MSVDTTSSERSLERKCFFKVINKGEEHLYFSVKQNKGRWSRKEHKIFLEEVLDKGIKNWKRVFTFYSKIYFFLFSLKKE
jgi:hypothetical protein